MSREEFLELTKSIWTFSAESAKKLVILLHSLLNCPSDVLSYTHLKRIKEEMEKLKQKKITDMIR